MFYTAADARSSTAIEPCSSALNRVEGMPFAWSLNPYMGCVHRCTFCYVRAFELRADRPSGRALRHLDPRQVEHRRRAPARARAAVVARRERRDRRRDRSVPAGGGPLPADARLPRGARRSGEPVRADHPRPDDRARPRRAGRGRAARRGLGHLLGADARRRGLAADRARHRPAAPAPARARASSSTPASATSVGMAPILPGISDRPEQLAEVVRAAREAGACGIWANVLYLQPGTREHFLESLAPRLAGAPARVRAALRRRAYLPQAEDASPCARRCASSRAATGSATGAARRSSRRREPAPMQLELVAV